MNDSAETPPDLKTCPACAEEVKRAASICRFCGYDFATGLRANQPTAAPPVAEPAAAPAPPAQPSPREGLGCLAIAGVVIIAASGWCMAQPSEPAEPDWESTARVLCKDAVRGQLRSPSTADFGSYSETTARPVAGKPGQWIVNGTVTAVNAFNAPIVNIWVCDADVNASTARATIITP